ncbi:hypothetical protein GCK32_021946 [Trichostrongylus colubriformis]|uniref:Uncharacterized protein n=1 Tax=Trichostrongylus colubriformis TaxID=6319 RepID=A0AAN8FN70_TRICO
MKLHTTLSPKAEYSTATVSEKLSDEETISEKEQSRALSGPKSNTNLMGIAKEAAISVWKWKKDKCCLMPNNCCLLSDKCCLTKLQCVRQFQEKFHPKEAGA